MLADTATVSRSSWDPKSRQVCSVLLGQILHEAQDDTSARHMKAEEVLKLQYKTMSSSISGALLTLQNLPIRKISESLYIRLLPSPWTSLGLGSMQAFPEVEMRVGLLGNDKRPFLQRVSAILEQKFSDVMLPEQRADLRFRREAFLDLANARKDEVVADFLAKSKLDTLGTGRLRAPANIKLHIPRWVIQEKGIDISNRITRESGIEEVEMDYLFSGLEYRHSLVLNWEAYRLEYNTIEAGKIGGRRTELHLVNEPRKATFSYLSRIPTNVDRFIASAYRLVNRLGKLASNEAIARNISSTRPLVREAKTPDYLDIYNTSRMLFDPSDDGSVLVQSSVQKAWAERELHDQDMVDEELADQDSVNADSVSNNAGGEDFHDENSVKKDLDVKAEPNDSNLQDVLGKETSD